MEFSFLHFKFEEILGKIGSLQGLNCMKASGSEYVKPHPLYETIQLIFPVNQSKFFS
jgi:hypothetical protein